MSELTGDANYGRSDKTHKKPKKRTHGEANGETAGVDVVKDGHMSKEEKREAKRLKKLEKANGSGKDKDMQYDSILVPENPVQDTSNDVPTAKEPSKEERRGAKRLKKSQKPDLVVRVPEEATTVQGEREDVADQATAKALRKAEKARLKATKKVAKDEGQTRSVVADAPNGHATESKGQQSKKQKHLSKPSENYEEDSSLAALPQSEIDTFLSANHIAIDDPTSTSPLRPITQFSYLPHKTISDPSIFATFKSPTPIQSAAWPFLLSNRDVIGVAETGSGKTLAFGVPCIRSITTSPKSSNAAKALIVSPTRELAVQIHTQIDRLATPASLTTACIYGGVPKDPQRAALSTASIIVATPGRLHDLINEGSANLSSVHYLVLDEADRMLDKGFEEEIRKIISQTPTTGRQTLMFTATWPPSVRTLASTFMTTPVHISIGANNPSGELRANTSITQHVEVLEPRAKESRLLQILSKYHHSKQNKQKQKDRILIFALYKKEAARLESLLLRQSLPAAAIHGDLTQTARQSSLDNFKSGATPLLVATDVAARGLDIPSVKLVINVTFPLTVEDYVHRIGRTGRAGAEGEAITLFTEHDKGNAGGLINVLKAAGQEVPEDLMRFGTTVKRKGHEAYGAFYKDVGEGKKEGTKIRFD